MPSDLRSRSALLAEFRHALLQVLPAALTQTKEKDNIEIDILARVGL